MLLGTRSAVFAPMKDLGLVMIMDDGDDLLVDPHAPYPHTRDVAAIRASQQGSGLLFAAHGRTAEVQAWVERGWLAPIELTGPQTRRAAPAVRVSGDSDQSLERDPLARAARLPRLAFETIRTGLTAGPVLVQVPRAGYLVALSCQRCRTPVRCPHCSGPVRLTVGPGGARTLGCGWCARVLPGFRCVHCGGTELRAPVVGSSRTAEELGRAFPGYRLIDSSGDRVVDSVGDQPAVVVATPGAEPVAASGYSAAVLLDAALLLTRADLRASEEALRRWLNAMALVRGGAAGGSVCVVGPSENRAVQAVVRVDPGGLASRELAERREAGFPPASCLVTVEGAGGAVEEFAAALQLPPDALSLGPVEVGHHPRPGRGRWPDCLVAAHPAHPGCAPPATGGGREGGDRRPVCPQGHRCAARQGRRVSCPALLPVRAEVVTGPTGSLSSTGASRVCGYPPGFRPQPECHRRRWSRRGRRADATGRPQRAGQADDGVPGRGEGGRTGHPGTQTHLAA